MALGFTLTRSSKQVGFLTDVFGFLLDGFGLRFETQFQAVWVSFGRRPVWTFKILKARNCWAADFGVRVGWQSRGHIVPGTREPDGAHAFTRCGKEVGRKGGRQGEVL